MRNKSIILGILLSIVFFVVAYVTAKYFFRWTLTSKDVTFISTTLTDSFRQIFFYSLVVGLIPITIILLWQVTPVVSLKARVISCLVIIASIFLTGFLRYQWVKELAYRFMKTVKERYVSKGADIQPIFPISRVHIEIYMLIGLLLGSVMVYFIFRNKKKNIPQFSFDS